MGQLIYCQNASFSGKVLDKLSKEELIACIIVVYQSDSIVGWSDTDIDGAFKIENLPFGKYNVETMYLGYKSFKTQILIESADVYYDFELIESPLLDCGFPIEPMNLFNLEDTTSKQIFSFQGGFLRSSI